MLVYINFFFISPKIIHFYFYYNTFFLLSFFKYNKNQLYNLNLFLKNYKSINNFFFFFFNNTVNLLHFKFVSENVISSISYSRKPIYSSSFSNNLVKSLVNSVNINYYDHYMSFNSIYDNLSSFFFLKSDIMKTNLNFNMLKFNYFLILINSNWSLIINFNNIFRSIRGLLASNIGRYGNRQYGVYSIYFLWKFWSNLFYLLLNISFYNVQIISFSRIYFKKIVEVLNWLSYSYSFFNWKKLNLFFFFKYSFRNKSSFLFLKNFKATFNGVIFISDSNFHYSAIQFFNKLNLFNFAILDVNLEPWLSWYPIPGRGSDLLIQYIFLIFFFKFKVQGLNFYLIFKTNYLFLLKINNFLNIINNSILYL